MKALFISVMIVMSSSSYAVSLPLLLQLEQGQGQQKIELTNSDNIARSYNVSVQQVSHPNKSMAVIQDKTHEVWVSEQKFTLPAMGHKDIYVAYRGEPTSSEKYFNVIFNEVDLVVRDNSALSVGKVVNTLLTVLPLNTEMKVDFNGERLTNRSNATVLVMEDLECGRAQGNTILVAPGESIIPPKVKSGTILSVGLHDEIRVLANDCD
ncbi:MAG: hypothetical protein ACRCVV_09055 [Shewanella sp.]